MAGPLVAALQARVIIAPGIAELDFEMREPERLVFRAGQFVSISVDPVPSTADGASSSSSSSRRSYSIASQTTEAGHLRFIIRVVAEGASSSYLMTLPLGATVNLTGPHGFFVLDATHAGDVVFGATGTGMAAVMPMLGELAARIEPGRRHVYWGVREPSDLFARAEIEALAARAGATLSLHLTAPPAGWTGASGRITAAILEALPTLTAPTFYLVGNGAMITELKRELVARGVNRKAQIRTEAFFD
ncbi:MAG TPA: FAD-binding oxidoreductase [Polyangia bacterium]|jgi:CDP-4-dehydro-6-deoxyglucose reductase|nr:FAD-binding oxidoreductase [Polyangia bacterium]